MEDKRDTLFMSLLILSSLFLLTSTVLQLATVNEPSALRLTSNKCAGKVTISNVSVPVTGKTVSKRYEVHEFFIPILNKTVSVKVCSTKDLLAISKCIEKVSLSTPSEAERVWRSCLNNVSSRRAS